MKNLFSLLLIICFSIGGFSQQLKENFDDITTLETNGWLQINLSSPLGITSWFQGNPSVFEAYNGDTNAYISANFNNAAGVGTISNWLITPVLKVMDGDKLSFWTRTVQGNAFNDRLEVRMTQGAIVEPTNTTDVGSFTKVMTIINDEYNNSYPMFWTQYVLTVSGVGNTPIDVKFGLRYFIEDAGPSGNNSNYIGIDNLNVTGKGIYKITTLSTPAAGGTTSGGGSYLPGSSVTVKATVAPGYIFESWLEGNTVVSTNKNYSFTATAYRTLKAKFVKKSFNITTSPTPVAGGTTTGTGTYFYGQNLTVKATAATGYVFESWMQGNTVVSTNKNYSFTVDANRTLKAKFVKKSFIIGTLASPLIGGTTTGAGTYLYGQNVTVKAVANSGYRFDKWMQGNTVVSTNKNYSFTADANRTLKAKFVKIIAKGDISDDLAKADFEKSNQISNTVQVYPNPFTDFVWVDSGSSKIQNVQIYDLSGRLIYEQAVNQLSKFQLDAKSILKGSYLMIIYTDQGTQTIKVIKK